MFADTRIIARQSLQAGGLDVLAQRHEIMWRDGTAVQLHPVYANGLPMLTLRALVLQDGRLVLFDLAHLVPRLDAELRTCPERDVTGHVFFALRQAYRSAAHFSQDVVRHAMGTFWHLADGYVWQQAARAVDGEVLDLMACSPPRQRGLAGALQSLMAAGPQDQAPAAAPCPTAAWCPQC